jgi:DUF4097 and DUF4098 domain-containing protein YvlB
MNKAVPIFFTFALLAWVSPVLGSGRKTPGRRNSGQEQKLPRGGRVRIENPIGPVTVIGWDHDTVQATIDGDNSDQENRIAIKEEQSNPPILSIGPDYQMRRRGSELHLVIRLPRGTGIDSLNTGRGAIEISDIEGPVNVATRSGEIKITNVGPVSAHTNNGEIEVRAVSGEARVQTNSGDVTVSNVSGNVGIQTSNGTVRVSHTGQLNVHTSSGDITAESINGSATLQTPNGTVTAKDIKGDLTAKVASGDFVAENIAGLINLAVASGDIRARNVGGDIKVEAISSDIDIKCTKGAVDVSTASGSILLVGIAADVNAVSTSGEVTVSGPIRPHGHYRLKSVSGEVSILIPANSPGFTATLSSYNGEIDTDFPIKLDSPLEKGPINRTVVGVYGDGQANIALDSFSGTARLGKLPPHSTDVCK